jgi:hypothetical protein
MKKLSNGAVPELFLSGHSKTPQPENCGACVMLISFAGVLLLRQRGALPYNVLIKYSDFVVRVYVL